MTYDEKLEVANQYLEAKAGVTWNDLPDINSLHDVEDEESIKAACNDRLEEEGFPNDIDGDNDDGLNDFDFSDF